MDSEDLAALAAEYVLGTLPSDERGRAETLIATDPGFVDTVRQWERRLGELNVMVEAVEPPAEIWDKIKSEIGTPAAGEEVGLVPAQPASPGAAQVESQSKSRSEERGASAPFTALAANLSPSQSGSGTEPKPDAKSESTDTKSSGAAPRHPIVATTAAPKERGADAISLTRRIRRWRATAVLATLVAAGLAALIVISQVRPELIPAGRFHIPQLVARAPAPKPLTTTPPPPASRLIAVLQQGPASPAFLLTLDPAAKTLVVRRVAAQASAGHSFQLWLIPAKSTTPQALGVLGDQEFTQLKPPANFDFAAARTATFAVSFEPAGGSKTGAPSGPILFTGRLVESVPPAAPAAPPPKTQ